MNKVGIIFAMKEELNETKKLFSNVIAHEVYNLTIYECQSENTVCYLLESGVGKANAARSAQVLIDHMKVDSILNVGVAGSISREVNKCDIVIADKLVQHDFDLTPFHRVKGEIPNIGVYIDCDQQLLHKAGKITLDNKVVTGVIASGDVFVSDEKMGAEINKEFGALCVEMEGAAIAQVCHLCKVPFLVVRAISDSPYEKDNQITFDEFLKISSENAAKFVFQFLRNI